MMPAKGWMEKLKSRRGFTLGELMVTTIILLLSMLLITQSLESGVRQFYQRTQHSEADILCTAIEDAIQDELTYATNVETDTDKSVTEYFSHKVGKGAVFGILSTDGTTFTPIGSDLSASAKGYFAIDAEYYQNLSGATREYYLPVSKGSYDINSGSAGKLVAAVSIQAEVDADGNPTSCEANVEIYSAAGTTALVSDTFTTRGSSSLSRTGAAERKLEDYQVALNISEISDKLDNAANDTVMAELGWTAISGGYTMSVTEGSNVILPNLAFADDSENDYIRIQWTATDGASYAAPHTVTSVEGPMTFTASAVERPSHTITFMKKGDAVAKSVTVKEGKVITSSDIPADTALDYPDGSAEIEWYEKGITGKGSESSPYKSDLSDLYLNADKTLYPIVKYPITFDANDGTLLDGTKTVTNNVRYDGKILSSAPMNPTREGMSFAGWYTNPNDNSTKLESTTTVTGAVTYKAKWTYKYTITYVLDGGTLDVSEVPGGKKIGDNIKVELESEKSDPLSYTICGTMPTKEDYDFDGWLVEGTKSVYGVSQNISVSQDIILTAQWKGYTVNLYNNDKLVGTFTCDKSGGNIVFSAGDSFAHLQTTVQHDTDSTAWTFSGWYATNRTLVFGPEGTLRVSDLAAYADNNGVIRLDAGYVNNGTIYTRATALADGKSYIIVNADGAGTKKALSWGKSGNDYVPTFPNITVSSETIYDVNTGTSPSAYILEDNAKEDGVLVAWTAEYYKYEYTTGGGGPNGGKKRTADTYKLKRTGTDNTQRYLYISYSYDYYYNYYSLQTSDTNNQNRKCWQYADGGLQEYDSYRYNSSYRYIVPTTDGSGFSVGNSSKTIYLYEGHDAGTYLTF